MKKIKYIFEAIFVYFLFLIIKVFGLNLGRKLMSLIFSKVGFILKSKKVVKNNINNVFGNNSEIQGKGIVESMWKNYAYIFVE